MSTTVPSNGGLAQTQRGTWVASRAGSPKAYASSPSPRLSRGTPAQASVPLRGDASQSAPRRIAYQDVAIKPSQLHKQQNKQPGPTSIAAAVSGSIGAVPVARQQQAARRMSPTRATTPQEGRRRSDPIRLTASEKTTSPRSSIAAAPHASVATAKGSKPGRRPAEAAPQDQKVEDVEAKPAPQAPELSMSMPAPLDMPTKRLYKPHKLFPFDLFCGSGADGYLDEFLTDELGYVRDHCMVPPFPWGQVTYYNFIIENLLEVPGEFAEFGIGQGGTSLFFARLAKKYGRKFLAVDSFEGLPVPDMDKDNHYFVEGDYRPKKGTDNYANFMKYKEPYDVDDSLWVLKAFFGDAVIPEEFQSFAFVHMDSDLYDSVYDSLVKVWDKLSYGGVIAIDDFFHHAQGPARAVADFFRTKANMDEPPLMFVIPTYAVLIVKGRSACVGKRTEEDAQDFDGRRSVMYCPRALDGNFYSFKLMRDCKPFVQAARDSAQRAREACAEAQRGGNAREGLRRVSANADAFVAFLEYPEDAPRSGNDVLRYLYPLEDLFDISQGSLVGNRGEVRKTIEFII